MEISNKLSGIQHVLSHKAWYGLSELNSIPADNQQQMTATHRALILYFFLLINKI
jgi:hypothetical protein